MEISSIITPWNFFVLQILAQSKIQIFPLIKFMARKKIISLSALARVGRKFRDKSLLRF